MKILVTGFEAFHTNDENPTEAVIGLLPKSVKGHQVEGLCLPVDYDKAFNRVKSKIETNEYSLVIHLGLAQGRKHITPERIAINVDDASIPDNLGNVRNGSRIQETGDNAYFSTLPLSEIVDVLDSKNIPVKISNTAGTYLCNHIMYETLHLINENGLNIKSGFIHVPLMDEQKHNEKLFSLPLSVILEAVIDIIKISI